MGWISIAGCTLAAGIFLFTLYNKQQKDRRATLIQDGISQYPILKENKQSDGKKEKAFISEDNIAPSISINVEDETPFSLEESIGELESHPIFRVKSVDGKDVNEPDLRASFMPPPLRPASAPIPDPPAARLNTMPPPSSLPPSRNRSPPRLKPPTASMAPRNSMNVGSRSSLAPPSSFTSSLRPPVSSASALRVPSQKVLSNTKMQPALAPTTSTLPPSSRPSRKVLLAPGHSPLDWAALQRNTSAAATVKLRGPDAIALFGPTALSRITPTMLRRQTGRKGKDAWTVYQGKVYNVSAYLPFHPGGESELLKGAGRSSDKLFAEVHPWVNWEGMLAECLVGILVNELEEGGDSEAEKSRLDLDAMD